ncbi:hypothetical protein GCM10009715_13820 [Paeniglutamicibacter psychrophenolicus]|uniref:DUF2771 domain-containing protein n=1 Tax=Paeniglutamicibacter psychrophenolicus TaxID=257454 RepID=A0ABS4WBN8_9MICC|nr:hypothetical protein [Paeniglutamicibacter psychrophenolicus]MBP2373624.1 hypothetical protein [Paeniglutamicibacter psychrophenolicus]
MERSIHADAGTFRSSPLTVVSIGVLAVVVAIAGWAGYRMMDPVAGYGQGNLTCHSTAAPGVASGVLTTPWIEVKPGRSIQVRALTLVAPVNYALAGTGIQHDGVQLGAWEYPVGDGDPEMQATWLSRTELPATLEDRPEHSIIMALEPVDVNQESSLDSVRVRYDNQWGIPYSIDVGPRFEAKPNCLLDDEEAD